MSIHRRLITAALCLTLAASALASPREDARLADATGVLGETQSMPDLSVPNWLLQRAEGIAILPTVVKVGLVYGGRGGKGVLSARNPNGHWGNPVFINMAGGSIGWQAGIQTSDIILIFTTRRSLEGITGGKLTLGVDASVATGPVGRQASAATDIGLSEVYCYSRSKGLFAGVSIDGSIITIDGSANASFYQHPGILGSEIMAPNGPSTPAAARALLQKLDRVTVATANTKAVSPTRDTPQPTPVATPVAAAAPSDGRALESGGAATFPLEDKAAH